MTSVLPVAASRGRVLLVVRDGSTAYYLTELLQEWGYEPEVTLSREEAQILLARGGFSVLIADWDLPGQGGLALIRTLRSVRAEPYIYTILLSGSRDPREILEGVEAGADDILVAPYGPEEIEVRLRAARRILDLEAELREQNGALALANRVMERDLVAAGKLQRSMLPRPGLTVGEYSFGWMFEPCAYASGDMFNFFRLDEDHQSVFVLDVSGHGVASAMLSVTLSHALSPVGGHSNLVKRPLDRAPWYEIVSPQEVVAGLRESFSFDEGRGLYFTLLYGVLQLSTGRFLFSTAGHAGPLVLRADGSSESLEGPGGMPVGLPVPVEGPDRCAETTLQPGDRLVLYSDGLPEAVHAREDACFETARLLETLVTTRDEPIAESLAATVERVRTWQRRPRFEDDVTLVGVERAA